MNAITKKEFGYHGELIKKPYFEGWYYKIADTQFSIAIIVGINKNTKDDHGFIQTLDTISGKEQYIRFPFSQIQITKEPLHIQMGKNHFYKDSLIVDIQDAISVQLHVKLGDFHYLKPSIYAPTIMGPFSYLTSMECVHTVYSLYHRLGGQITINNQQVALDNAIGYIEKDRGTSFPNQYFWMQSNHSNDSRKISLFLSIASIPLKIIDFTGIIMAIMIGEEQLRFGSYYGATLKVIKKINRGYKVIIKQGKYLVCLKAYLGETFELAAPSFGEMKHMVYESLTSRGMVHVYKNGNLIHNISFTNAGCEVRGY